MKGSAAWAFCPCFAEWPPYRSRQALKQQGSPPWDIPQTHLDPEQPGRLALSGAGGSLHHLPSSLPTPPGLHSPTRSLLVDRVDLKHSLVCLKNRARKLIWRDGKWHQGLVDGWHATKNIAGKYPVSWCLLFQIKSDLMCFSINFRKESGWVRLSFQCSSWRSTASACYHSPVPRQPAVQNVNVSPSVQTHHLYYIIPPISSPREQHSLCTGMISDFILF